MNEPDINKRIIQLIDFLRLSKNEFSKKLGVSSSRISNITTFRNKPDSEMLQLILSKFRNVDAEWLLLGNGEIIKSKTEPITTDAIDSIVSTLLKENRQMAEEIGALKEQNRSLKKQLGYSNPSIAAES